MEPILESGMQFGIYPEEDLFHIENSALYTTQLGKNGVKCCEFILNRGKCIYFVEAKTSCPNQATAKSSREKAKKYNEYIKDITEKMRDSLSIYSSILLNRHEGFKELPENLAEPDLSKKTLKLVLVVKSAEKEWLIPLQDVLNREFKKYSSIWRDVKLYAMNEATAREEHFVI